MRRLCTPLPGKGTLPRERLPLSSPIVGTADSSPSPTLPYWHARSPHHVLFPPLWESRHPPLKRASSKKKKKRPPATTAGHATPASWCGGGHGATLPLPRPVACHIGPSRPLPRALVPTRTKGTTVTTSRSRTHSAAPLLTSPPQKTNHLCLGTLLGRIVGRDPYIDMH